MKILSQIRSFSRSRSALILLMIIGASLSLYYLLICGVIVIISGQFSFKPRSVYSYLFEQETIQGFLKGVVALDINENQVAIAGGPSLNLINLNTGLIEQKFSDPEEKYIDNVIFVDNNRILIGYTDLSLAILNVQSNQIERKIINSFDSIEKKSKFNPKSTYVLLQPWNGGHWEDDKTRTDDAKRKFLAWNQQSMSPYCTITKNKADGPSGALSPDNRFVALLDDIDNVRSIKIIRLLNCMQTYFFPLAAKGTPSFNQLQDRRKGKNLKLEFSYSYFLKSGKLIFSPDSKLIATNIYSQVWIYDVATQERIRVLGPSLNEKYYLQSIDFSPQGKFIAAASNTGDIKIWEVETGRLVKEIYGGLNIDKIRFTDDGKYVVVASAYQSNFKVWKTSL